MMATEKINIDWTAVTEAFAKFGADLKDALVKAAEVIATAGQPRCTRCGFTADYLAEMSDEALAEFWLIHNEVKHGAVL
jgi:hypothetical protein